MTAEQIISFSSIGGVIILVLVWTLKEIWSTHKETLKNKVNMEVCNTVHKSIDDKLDFLQASLDEIHRYIMDK